MAVGKALTGSPPADQTVVATTAKYMGFSVREVASSAAVAVFNIRSGSASGPIIDTVELVADGSNHRWFGPNGISAPDGIYFDIVSGEIAGTVYYS